METLGATPWQECGATRSSTLYGGRWKAPAPCRAPRPPSRARLVRALLDGLKAVFNTAGPVPIYPSSGPGAWEAALRNTL